MSLAAGTKLGPYEIVSPLGAGGMGEVYRAKDTRLERTVAIKILPAEVAKDAVRKQRFEREAKTISSLNHPNICTLHDIGSRDGVDYLVMECVEGEALAKRLEKGALPLEQVLKNGAQIADELDKAHRAGIVHRDLKPGNIMLTPTGAKLLDFGLAKPALPLVSGATLTAAMPTMPVTQEGTGRDISIHVAGAGGRKRAGWTQRHFFAGRGVVRNVDGPEGVSGEEPAQCGVGDRELIWLDRNGKKVGQVPGLDAYSGARISPDGKRLAYTLTAPNYDIWSYDLARGMKTRLTFGSASGQGNFDAVWSPNGRRIAYTSSRGGMFGFYQRSADGSGNEELLLEGTDTAKFANDWSPDSKFLAYQQYTPSHYDVWMLSLSGERKASPFLQSQFGQSTSAFSPDGKWLAYCSSESGEAKVYVVPFPGPGGKWQVSPGGGCYPRWRHDGKELFYLSVDNKVTAVGVSASGSSFSIGAVTSLFETPVYRSLMGAYDVSADGQHFFLVNDPGQPNAAITLGGELGCGTEEEIETDGKYRMNLLS